MKKYVLHCANSEKQRLINEAIGNARNRRILSDWFIDGLTQEAIAEKYDLSVRWVQEIVREGFHRIQTL